MRIRPKSGGAKALALVASMHIVPSGMRRPFLDSQGKQTGIVIVGDWKHAQLPQGGGTEAGAASYICREPLPMASPHTPEINCVRLVQPFWREVLDRGVDLLQQLFGEMFPHRRGEFGPFRLEYLAAERLVALHDFHPGSAEKETGRLPAFGSFNRKGKWPFILIDEHAALGSVNEPHFLREPVVKHLLVGLLRNSRPSKSSKKINCPGHFWSHHGGPAVL